MKGMLKVFARNVCQEGETREELVICFCVSERKERATEIIQNVQQARTRLG